MDSPTLPSHGSPTPAPAGTVIGPSTCTVTPSGARNANCASSPRCSRRIWKLGLRADHTFTASRHLRNPRVHDVVGERAQVVVQLGEHAAVAPAELRRLGPLDEPVVEDPVGRDEHPLAHGRLRLVDLGQPREVIGVAVRDDHAVDPLRPLDRGARVARRQVARELHVLAAVDDERRAARRLQHRGVALLDVDEVDPQDLRRAGDVDRHERGLRRASSRAPAAR